MAEFNSQTYIPDALTAGNEHLLVGKKVTISTLQNLRRGAVLGKVDVFGTIEYVLSDAGASNGSEIPDLILAEDCDATDGAKEAMAYSRGDFNASAMVLGDGHTIDSIKEGLRVKGIIIVGAGVAGL